MLAYLDSIASGLVPVKVTRVEPVERIGTYWITATVTADRGAYRKGETVDGPGTHIIPRSAVHKRRAGSFRIRPYSWADYR